MMNATYECVGITPKTDNFWAEARFRLIQGSGEQQFNIMGAWKVSPFEVGKRYTFSVQETK